MRWCCPPGPQRAGAGRAHEVVREQRCEDLEGAKGCDEAAEADNDPAAEPRSEAEKDGERTVKSSALPGHAEHPKHVRPVGQGLEEGA